MIQFKITKNYLKIIIEIVFGFRSAKNPNPYILQGSQMADPRDININYLVNRTIWPKNFVEYLYDFAYEKDLNHELAMKVTCETLLKKQKEATKEDLLLVEKTITIENLSLQLN